MPANFDMVTYSYRATVNVWKADGTETYHSITRAGTRTVPSGESFTVYVPLDEVYTRDGYNFLGYGSVNSTIVRWHPGDSIQFTFSSSGEQTFPVYCIWEQIERANISSISSPVTIGASPGGTVAWTIPDSSFTYELKLTCGNAPAVTYQIAENVSSKQFNIPNTWLSTLSNVTSATALATLTTKSGSTIMGSSTMEFTVSVASSVKPTLALSAAQVSTNATVNSWNKYVQGFSKVKITATATAGTGATIASYSFSGPSLTYTGTDSEKTSGVIDASGSVKFTVSVTDSRGRKTTKTKTVTFKPYSTPVISGIDTNRCEADGTTDNGAGEYLKVTPHYSISSVSSLNSITAQALYYREHGSNDPWTTLVDPCANNTTYAKPTYSWAISLSKSYDIRCVVTDALSSTREFITALPGAGGIWYGRDNDRIGIGGVPPGPGAYFFMDAYFKEKFLLGSTELTEAELIDLLNGGGGGVQVQQDPNTGVVSIL